jgi:hypothetical protein
LIPFNNHRAEHYCPLAKLKPNSAGPRWYSRTVPSRAIAPSGNGSPYRSTRGLQRWLRKDDVPHNLGSGPGRQRCYSYLAKAKTEATSTVKAGR